MDAWSQSSLSHIELPLNVLIFICLALCFCDNKALYLELAAICRVAPDEDNYCSCADKLLHFVPEFTALYRTVLEQEFCHDAVFALNG